MRTKIVPLSGSLVLQTQDVCAKYEVWMYNPLASSAAPSIEASICLFVMFVFLMALIPDSGDTFLAHVIDVDLLIVGT